MTFKKLLPFICLATLVITSTAYAQGSGIDKNGEPYSNKYWVSQPSENVISLVRKPTLNEDQFILRISDSHPLNGCVNLGNYGYSAEYRDIYLDITIGSRVIDMRGQPQYAHFQCNQQSQIPVADIILNRQDLLSNVTTKIRMHNGSDTNYYDIILNDNMVKILPDSTGSRKKRFKPHKIPGKKTSLLYWFYPVGTILMWVPTTESSPDTIKKLRAFATEKGLVPLETVYTDFKSPLMDRKYQYFVDTAGHFTDNDPDMINGKPIGNISIEKTVYGLEKDEIELDEIAVYAKIPGMYE